MVDTFEPGSTIKPVVVALSIDEGKVRPQSIIDTAPGWYRIGPAVIHDTSNHGAMTVAEAVQKSSNIALAKLALNLPAETIWNKYQEYGLGLRPELTFPGVASGKVRPYKRWRPIEQATMAYGYGLSASLLQIAQVYTAYAGDGTMHRVSLLRHATDSGAAGAATTLPENRQQRVTTARHRALDPLDAGNGHRRRRHRPRGSGGRLPDRRQDRHGA